MRSSSKHDPIVMAGLVPAIHVLLLGGLFKTWMPGTSPGMTVLAQRTGLEQLAGSVDFMPAAGLDYPPEANHK
jgi:hypothetical protein